MTDDQTQPADDFRNVSEWHTQAVRARDAYFANHPDPQEVESPRK